MRDSQSRVIGWATRGPTLAALLVALLGLAGCGDSGDTGPAAAEPTPAAAVEPTPALPATPVAEAPAAPPAGPALAAEPAPLAAPAAVTATPPPPGTPTPAVVAQGEPAPPPEPAAPPAALAPIPTPAVAADPAPVAAAPSPPAAPTVAATDPALAARLAAADPAAGEPVAARCVSCHSFDAGGPTIIGPNLYGIVGAAVGSVAGFTYSPAFQGLHGEGATWTYDRLDAFLASPSTTVPGTRMGFGGLPDETQRANLVAYLRTLSADPVPLPGGESVDPFRAELIGLGLLPVAFATEQVQIGRDYYTRYCSTCHGVSFQGIFYGAEWGQAPALIGARFEQRWFRRPVGDLVDAMEKTDILNYASLHDGLAPDRYVAIAAYLLEQYGFTAGDVPLPVEPEALRSIGFWQ